MLFSHDGIHDSQTHLASPSFFYEQLKREISIGQRSGKPVSLVKIRFDNHEYEKVQAKDILHFSYELIQLTRSEDCIGRLGINEVVVIIRDGHSNAEQFVRRILESRSLTVNQTLNIKLSTIHCYEGENSQQLLERLDRAELITM